MHTSTQVHTLMHTYNTDILNHAKTTIHACQQMHISTQTLKQSNIHASKSMHICKHANTCTQAPKYTLTDKNACMYSGQTHVSMQKQQYKHANTCTQACKHPNTHI